MWTEIHLVQASCTELTLRAVALLRATALKRAQLWYIIDFQSTWCRLMSRWLGNPQIQNIPLKYHLMPYLTELNFDISWETALNSTTRFCQRSFHNIFTHSFDILPWRVCSARVCHRDQFWQASDPKQRRPLKQPRRHSTTTAFLIYDGCTTGMIDYYWAAQGSLAVPRESCAG